MNYKSARAHELGCCAGLMLVHVGGAVLLRNSPFVVEVRLTVLSINGILRAGDTFFPDNRHYVYVYCILHMVHGASGS